MMALLLAFIFVTFNAHWIWWAVLGVILTTHMFLIFTEDNK